MKAFVAAIVAASLAPAAWAGFIIEDAPEAGSSWSQRIVLNGSFDAIAFEIVSHDPVASPFGPPGNFQVGPATYHNPGFAAAGITDFADPSDGGVALAGWNADLLSPNLAIATGLDTSSMAITLHFTGEIQPITFRGVAFQDGEFQFSAEFVWDGVSLSNMDLGLIDIRNIDGWQPDPESVGMAVAIPLPAPVWLGSLGLLAVIILRRKFH